MPVLLGIEAPQHHESAPDAEQCLPGVAAAVVREGDTQATVPVQVLQPPFL